jgi:hypothetical protein
VSSKILPEFAFWRWFKVSQQVATIDMGDIISNVPD